jgi:LPXTG-site transpeptidase (sortase) family protein
MRSIETRTLVWIRATLIAVGVLCLAWVGVTWMQAALFARQQRLLWSEERAAAAVREAPARPLPSEAPPTPGSVIGILDIPRLGFSEIVAEGDGDDVLRVAVGHLPDTPLPWQPGNSALAGHRDQHFRPLADVRIGDRIRLTTRHGDFNYRLREIRIVLPTDLSVLEPTSERQLTLITCYPFTFIGRAPKRFVMLAEAE